MDGKKNIFQVEVIPATTSHALDKYLDTFLSLTATLQLGQNQAGPGCDNGDFRAHRDMLSEDNILKK